MRWLAGLLALVSVLAGCVGTAPPTQPLGALDAPWFTGLTSHAALQDRLALLDGLGVSVEPIGESVEGRAMHLLRLGHGPFELWLAARHHGNEPTSTEAVLNTVDYLLGRKAPGDDALPVTKELYAHRDLLLDRLTFAIIPMVNPDGAEAYRRINSHGQDLNRDYLLFSEPESRAVRDAFWQAWPDAGLDLHNEGLDEEGGFDFDAYYPEVPRAESDTQELSLANQWLVVHEIDASGGRGGGPNENYVTSSVTDPCQYLNRYVPAPLPSDAPLAPPTDNTDPTAYCEGTHDAFLTLRGAPGWTPEAGIGWDEPEAPTLPWAIRLHEATIAATALQYAGVYAGCLPQVQKFAGLLRGTTTIPVDVAAPGARFQVVWRSDAAGLDQQLDELDLTLRTPSGQLLGPEQHPLGYTESLASPEAGAHLATLTGRAPLGTPYELRVHACVPGAAALQVERLAEGLRATNRGPMALDAEVQDALPGEPAVAAPGAEVAVVRGNLGPRTVLTWRLVLQPGEARDLSYQLPAGAEPGPGRWHAHGPTGEVLLGVGEERAAP